MDMDRINLLSTGSLLRQQQGRKGDRRIDKTGPPIRHLVSAENGWVGRLGGSVG